MDIRPRRQLVIDRSFQLQYLYIWLAIAVGILLLCGGFYVLVRTTQGRIDPVMSKLLVGVSVFVVLFSLLMGILSVAMTHRVAGAAFRLEQSLQRLKEGDLDVSFSLRKGDYLQNLAQSLEELKGLFARERRLRLEALAHLERLQSSVGNQFSAEDRNRLSSLCEQLRQTEVPTPV